MQQQTGSAPTAEALSPELLDAKIARMMARISARTPGDTTVAEVAVKPSTSGRAFKVPALSIQSTEPSDDDYGQSPRALGSLKAVYGAAPRMSIHAVPLGEGGVRGSLQNNSGSTSPARSNSAAEALSIRDRSPPGQRDFRPRAQSTPPSAAALYSAAASATEDIVANGRQRSLLEQRGETAGDSEAARRNLRRPTSFEKHSSYLAGNGAEPDAYRRRLGRASNAERHDGTAPPEMDVQRRLGRPSSFEKRTPEDRHRADAEPHAGQARSVSVTKPDEEPRRGLPPRKLTEEESDGEHVRYRPEAEPSGRLRLQRPISIAEAGPYSPRVLTPSPSAAAAVFDSSPHSRGRRANKAPSFRVHIPSDSSDASDIDEPRYGRSPGHRNMQAAASGSDSDTSQSAISPTAARRRMASLSLLSRRTSEASEADSDSIALEAAIPFASLQQPARQAPSEMFAAATLTELQAALGTHAKVPSTPGECCAMRAHHDKQGPVALPRLHDSVHETCRALEHSPQVPNIFILSVTHAVYLLSQMRLLAHSHSLMLHASNCCIRFLTPLCLQLYHPLGLPVQHRGMRMPMPAWWIAA